MEPYSHASSNVSAVSLFVRETVCEQFLKISWTDFSQLEAVSFLLSTISMTCTVFPTGFSQLLVNNYYILRLR